MAIPCCGVVSEWSFGAANSGDLTAQVWKQTAGSTYEVVGETLIAGVTAGSTVRYGPSSPISVEQGYVFGWHSSGNDIVPYETDASVAMGIVSSSGKTALGGTNTWSNGLVDGERWHFGVTVSPNSVPYFTTLPTTVNAFTSDAVGTVLHTLIPTDDNADDIANLSISINPASTEFELNGNDVQILGTLAVQDYEVVVEVVDHCLQTGTATLTIHVTDNGPEIDSLPVAAPYELMEDTEIETLLHDLTFTDVDTDPTEVTCSIDSTIPSPAPIKLKYKPTLSDYGVYFVPNNSNHLDYDVVPTYYINIVCNDGTSDSDIELFQVDIVPNEPPVPTIPASIDVSADTTDAGTIVYTITATDASVHPDGVPDTLTFTMDNCSCPFRMNPNGEIYSVEDLNSHRTSPYIVDITVQDEYRGYQYNTVGPTQMTIHIIDINAPPNITNPTEKLPDIDTVHVYEHAEEGPNAPGVTITPVFTPAGYDDDGDDITWEMDFVNGKGEDLFFYNPATNAIETLQDLDYETLSRDGLLTTQVELRAFDGRQYSETRTLNIVVDDVNETPIFEQTKYAIETLEGTATTTTLECPLFAVTDEDLYDTRSYDIDCGAVGYFHLPSTRTPTCDAIVQQTQEHDLDNPGAASEIITCVITVKDKGDLTATTTLEITVKEDDDNPPVLDQTSYVYTITNDSTPGTTFGSFSSDDEDFLAEHRLHTYTTSSSEFGADPNGVFFTTKDWTPVNAPVTRKFTLYATDEAGHVDSSEVTVNIIDIPTVTTTTPPPTTIPPTYDSISSFLDDPGNLAWLIPAVLLGALMLGLMGFMCFRCCMTPGACLNACRGGSGGNCFGRGSRGGRLFGRRTMVKRAPAPKRVVSRPRPVRVVEERRPVRVVEKRPVTVIEEKRPVRVVEEPPPVVKEPVQQEPPPTKSSFFDRFKKKPPTPAPKAVDEPKKWHLWTDKDFMSNDKWVG